MWAVYVWEVAAVDCKLKMRYIIKSGELLAVRAFALMIMN